MKLLKISFIFIIIILLSSCSDNNINPISTNSKIKKHSTEKEIQSAVVDIEYIVYANTTYYPNGGGIPYQVQYVVTQGGPVEWLSYSYIDSYFTTPASDWYDDNGGQYVVTSYSFYYWTSWSNANTNVDVAHWMVQNLGNGQWVFDDYHYLRPTSGGIYSNTKNNANFSSNTNYKVHWGYDIIPIEGDKPVSK